MVPSKPGNCPPKIHKFVKKHDNFILQSTPWPSMENFIYFKIEFPGKLYIFTLSLRFDNKTTQAEVPGLILQTNPPNICQKQFLAQNVQICFSIYMVKSLYCDYTNTRFKRVCFCPQIHSYFSSTFFPNIHCLTVT